MLEGIRDQFILNLLLRKFWGYQLNFAPCGVFFFFFFIPACLWTLILAGLWTSLPVLTNKTGQKARKLFKMSHTKTHHWHTQVQLMVIAAINQTSLANPHHTWVNSRPRETYPEAGCDQYSCQLGRQYGLVRTTGDSISHEETWLVPVSVAITADTACDPSPTFLVSYPLTLVWFGLVWTTVRGKPV